MPLSRLMMKVKSTVSVILRNMEEERELLDGLHALDPDSDAYKPYTLKYRGGKRSSIPPPQWTSGCYDTRSNGGSWS